MRLDDDIYENAQQIIITNNRASISLLQRKLIIGYNRAARLMERMEEDGIVSKPDHNGGRIVLASAPKSL